MACQVSFRTIVQKSLIFGAASLSLALAGCAMGSFAGSPAGNETGLPTPGPAVRGSVHGGQNPVVGGKVYLYAAGTSAAAHTYGTGATSLLTSAVLANNTTVTDTASSTGVGGTDGSNYYVTTDATGSFNISNDYACPGAVTSGGVSYPSEVYVVILGGDSGGGTNSNIALMAALGQCTSAGALAMAVPFVSVNEVTTIAAVWALQQFMAVPTGSAGTAPNIGAPSTNLVGLQNAFTTAANLANIGTGMPAPVNTFATPEADHIYTIADILSYCVNSNSTSSNCSNLFASVKPASSALSTKGVAASTLNAPADTIQAAWYLAQFPNNVGGTGSCGTTAAAFECIQSVGAPFTAMSSEPNDWTLAVGYAPQVNSANAISAPFYVATDFYGNAWLTNYNTATVVPLGPSGSAIYAPVSSYDVGAASGYATTLGDTSAPKQSGRVISHPREITIDSAGNAWLADWNSVSTGAGETPITNGCTNTICFYGTVAKFPAATGPGTAPGTVVSGYSADVTGYYVPANPFSIAADPNGNVFMSLSGGSTQQGSKAVGELSATGVWTEGGGAGSHDYKVALDNNLTAGGSLLWSVAQEGCVAGGGEGSLLQEYQPVAALVAATGAASGSGANSCTTAKFLFTGNTGTIMGLAFDAQNGLWMVNSSTELGAPTKPGVTGGMNSVTYGVTTVPTGPITNWLISSNRATFTANNSFVSGETVTLSGFTGTGSFFNGQVVTVLSSVTSTTFQATFTHANQATTAENGLATARVALIPTGAANSVATASSATLGVGGLNNPQYVAVDGAGNAWVSNFGGSQVSAFSVSNRATASMAINALSGANGFQHNETGSALGSSEGIAIDLSGNVWVANNAAGVNYATVLVGAATPVAPVIPGQLGVAP